MGRSKKVPRIFEEGQVTIFKRTGTSFKGYEVLFILEKTIDKKGTRYIHLEINIGATGAIYQSRYDYAESTFKQRIRGLSNKSYYEEMDKDQAKLEIVVSTGKSLSMILQEAIANSKRSVNRRIDWYNKKIEQEKKQLDRLEKARSFIE